MTVDIFISHSSEDKTIADATCACLESRGLRCWVAPRDIVAGASWSESIIDAINDSKVMVLILSSHSNVSKQVLREIERAANRGIPILPFRINDVQLTKSLEYFLSSSHWLDAYKGPLKQNVEQLANNVAIVLEKQDAVRPLDNPKSASLWRRRAMLPSVAIALCALALGISVFWRTSDDNPVKNAQIDESIERKSDADTDDAPAVNAKNTKVVLGVELEDLFPQVAKHLGAVGGGVGVTRVNEQQKCGVRPGDVLLAFKDQPVSKVADLFEELKTLSKDEEYSITVLRDRSPLQVTLRPLEVKLFTANPFYRSSPGRLTEWYSEDEADVGKVVFFNEILRLDPLLSGTFKWFNAPDNYCVGVDCAPGRRLTAITSPGVLSRRRLDVDVELEERVISKLRVADEGPIWTIDARTRELVIWDPAFKTVVSVLDGITEGTEEAILEITNDAQKAVVVDKEGVARIWDLKKGSEVSRFSLKDAAQDHDIYMSVSKYDKCSLSGNGRHLSQCASGCAIIWDLEHASVARVLRSDARIELAQLSIDGQLVAIADEDGLIEVYKVADGSRVAKLRWHSRELNSLKFLSPRYLVSVSDGVVIWDLDDESVAWGWNAEGASRVAFDAKAGTMYVSWNFNGSLHELALPTEISQELQQCAWSDDTVSVIAKPSKIPSVTMTTGDGGSREITDFSDGSKMITVRDASGEVSGMHFQADSDSYALGVRLGNGSIPVDATTRAEDGWTVQDVVTGGQAARDGVIRKGDVITAVIERDGAEPTQIGGLFFGEVAKMFWGREGTSVRLLVRREGASEPLEIEAKRGRVLPVKNKAAKSDFENSIGMEFKAVPGGIGSLGFSETHYVRISRGFLIGAHEVTQEEFASVMGSRPSAYSQDGKNREDVAKSHSNGTIPNSDTSYHPVDSVSWEDAIEFCKRLGEKEGYNYRLPTEAEWEWACRNGGKIAGERYGEPQFTNWKPIEETAVGLHFNHPTNPHPVGSRTPNEGGIYDMFGNVAEWCADAFANDGFSNAAFVDPHGPVEGFARVVRGGYFKDFRGEYFERVGLAPTETRPYVGFRVVLDASNKDHQELNGFFSRDESIEFDLRLIPKQLPVSGFVKKSEEEEEKSFDELQARFKSQDYPQRDDFFKTVSANQTHFNAARALWQYLPGTRNDQIQALIEYNKAAKLTHPVPTLEFAREYDLFMGWIPNDIAWALATNSNKDHRDGVVAVCRAIEACETTRWQYWGFLDTLAVALAEVGEFGEAKRIATAAREMAPTSEHTYLERLIKLYDEDKTYSE